MYDQPYAKAHLHVRLASQKGDEGHKHASSLHVWHQSGSPAHQVHICSTSLGDRQRLILFDLLFWRRHTVYPAQETGSFGSFRISVMSIVHKPVQLSLQRVVGFPWDSVSHGHDQLRD